MVIIQSTKLGKKLHVKGFFSDFKKILIIYFIIEADFVATENDIRQFRKNGTFFEIKNPVNRVILSILSKKSH